MNQQASRDQIRFVDLMRAGHIAYAKGKHHKAHQIWRRAAMMRPYEEQVWLALLSVLDSDNDRRVCLQNIIAINPNNLQAKDQLRQIESQTSPNTQPVQRVIRPAGQHMPGRFVLRALQSVLIGGLIALGILIMQHAA